MKPLTEIKDRLQILKDAEALKRQYNRAAGSFKSEYPDEYVCLKHLEFATQLVFELLAAKNERGSCGS